jgi:ABC-type transport system involved in multi-copper enzyme maturation permease subunit
MQRIFAIASLTWKAAFRFRLFWALAALLLASVVALPLLLKDDGTARGLTQILLTYTLSSVTGLLGLATLWIACGTLAHDIEDCQMQMVTVKPISRWQVWVGKWVGIMALNITLVAASGAAIYGLLLYRANKLPEQERAVLKKEIFVARASVKPTHGDAKAQVEATLNQIVKKQKEEGQIPNETVLRKQIEQSLAARRMTVPPNYSKRFVIDLGPQMERLRGQKLQARVKFQSSDPMAQEGKLFTALWQVGPPDSGKLVRLPAMSCPANSYQEFDIPEDIFDSEGKLTLEFVNVNETTLYFGDEDGMEILYPEGGFRLNFIRGLGVILSWLALFTALGLAAASWLTFPVAAFLSLTFMILGLSSGMIASSVEQNSVFGYDESRRSISPVGDKIALPVFKGVLAVIHMVKGFSPVDSLSSGRSITWGELGLAFFENVVVLGGILAGIGILLFNRRELAALQNASS